MKMLIIKYLVTSALVVGISEIAKRSGKVGALIGALPLMALLVLVWMKIEQQANDKLGEYARYTFWYVIPSLPMFLLLPFLLKRGCSFWPAMGLSILSCLVAFFITAWFARFFDIELLP